MEPFLIRLLIAALIIWLVQTLLAAVALKDPAGKIIFVVTVVIAVLWAVTGIVYP